MERYSYLVQRLVRAGVGWTKLKKISYRDSKIIRELEIKYWSFLELQRVEVLNN